MSQPTVTLIDCGDLPRWETELLETVVRALEGRVQFERHQVSNDAAARRALELRPRAWLWTRRWRERVPLLEGIADGSAVFLPVFDPSAAAPRMSLGFRATLLPKATRLVAMGELSYRFLEKLERVPAPLLAFAPLPMPIPSPTQIAREGRAPTLGTLAPFVIESNLTFFLSVAHSVAARMPEARFLMAGSGPLEEHLRACVKELGLEERTAVVTVDESLAVRRCDAFLFAPIRCDHLGPLLFAGAYSRPTLLAETLSDETGLRDAREGLYFPFNEAEPAAELALRLLADRSLAQGVGQGMRRALETRFGTQAVAARWEALFNDTVVHVPADTAVA